MFLLKSPDELLKTIAVRRRRSTVCDSDWKDIVEERYWQLHK